MLEYVFAHALMGICLTLMAMLLVFMILFGIYHFNPELWKLVKTFFKHSNEHNHKFPIWEYIDRIPSIYGGSTGFAVAFCSQDNCKCVAVIPKACLMEFATPEYRKEFLEVLKKSGWKLID